MPQPELRTVSDGSENIYYLLERKRIKNINLRISREGQVRVSAPLQVPTREIDAFVTQKSGFIQKARQHWEHTREHALSVLQYITGEQFFYLGRPIRLLIQDGPKNGVALKNDQLVLTLRTPAEKNRREKLFRQFWQAQCRQVFYETALAVYPWFRAHEIPFPEIRLRDMKSRWGSCLYRKGIITLNTQLLQYPPACIRYVVIHELSHFIYPDHSPAFWSVVAANMPDWKRYRQALKQAL